MKKKKVNLKEQNQKEIRGLREQLKKLIDLLGVETKGLYWGRSFDLVSLHFKEDSPIEKIDKKINLILDNLGLEYKSREDRIEGVEGKLCKKQKKRDKGSHKPVIYHKKTVGIKQ